MPRHKQKPDAIVTFRAVFRDRDVDMVLGMLTTLLVQLDGKCLAIESGLKSVKASDLAKLRKERDRIRLRARRERNRVLSRKR